MVYKLSSYLWWTEGAAARLGKGIRGRGISKGDCKANDGIEGASEPLIGAEGDLDEDG